MFWDTDGRPISAEDFLKGMFGELPQFFADVRDLQEKWAVPSTREALLKQLDEAGYGKEVLKQIRTLIDAEGSDLLDVLEYIAYNIEPMERSERVKKTAGFVASLTPEQQEFVDYIINLYLKEGVEELGMDKLPTIMQMKYGSIPDGMSRLGGVNSVKNTFVDLQKSLYM